MKRVKCPKCDNFITFDETRYEEGRALFFQCSDCGKEFGIRIGTSKLHNRRKEELSEVTDDPNNCGSLLVMKMFSTTNKSFRCVWDVTLSAVI